MKNESRRRTWGDRVRDAVLALVVVGMVAQVIPSVFAAWDKTKPANNSALVSSEIRANWTELENAFGPLDAATLQQKNTNFLGTVNWTVLPTGIGAMKLGRATADFTKNANTTLGDVTGMSFSIGANETWTIVAGMKVISNSTADAKFAITGPAAATAVWYDLDSGSGIGVAPTANAFAGAVDASTGGAGAVDEGIRIHGLIRNGANAGTVQVQFAQLTSNASNSIVRQDSWILGTRTN